MKIKADKLRIEKGGNAIELANVELNISPKEIFEMNEFENKKSAIHIPSALREYKRLSYTFIKPKSWSGKGAAEICVGDEVQIMCSEDCVTNADTIKYDEKISGLKCHVSRIDSWNNKILLSNCFYVHPTWLKLISRKK